MAKATKVSTQSCSKCSGLVGRTCCFLCQGTGQLACCRCGATVPISSKQGLVATSCRNGHVQMRYAPQYPEGIKQIPLPR